MSEEHTMKIGKENTQPMPQNYPKEALRKCMLKLKSAPTSTHLNTVYN